MSIRNRLSRVARAWRSGDDDAGELKDKLDATYRSQTALLQQLRRGVADVATSRKRVQLQIAQIAQQTAQLDDEARQAVSRGDDDAARSALTRKVTLETAAAELDERHAALQAEEQQLHLTAQRIERDVEDFRVRKDTLSARHTAATARSEVNSATTGITSATSEVGQAMEAAERHTRELEATADAVDELVSEGVIGTAGESQDDVLRRRFDAALDDTEVERQLDAIAHPKDTHGPNQIS